MQNGVDGLKKEDAELLTVLLPPPFPPPLLMLMYLQACIGLLAYPEADSAPPESQLLLHPSFKHRTASLVNVALIQATHPSCCDPPISSSPLTDALAATVALQKNHLDACWGRGLTFELKAQNEVQFSEVLMQQIRRQEQHQRQQRDISSAPRSQQDQQSHFVLGSEGSEMEGSVVGFAEID